MNRTLLAILVFACIFHTATGATADPQPISTDNSYLLDCLKVLLENRHCLQTGSEFSVLKPLASQGAGIIFLLILVAWITSAYFWLKQFIWWFRNKKKNILTFSSEMLLETAVLIFVSGMAIYFMGYAYAGTGSNCVTLLLRSMLSSFEMFLSKSNLIGVAKNCSGNPVYMLFFALIHFLALTTSMVFAVTCFGKRIVDWFRGCVWQLNPFTKPKLNVFWGLNEKSFLLAKDIYSRTGGKERIVFIDFPQEEDMKSNGLSFSGLLGLLSYKTNIAKQLSGIHYILLKSNARPSEAETDNENFLRSMGLSKVGKFMKSSGKTDFFLLTDNEPANLRASLKILDSDIGTKINQLYCSARRTRVTRLQEDCYRSKLHLLDDSHESVMELSMRKDDSGRNYAHPIHFVNINRKSGYVESGKPFTALIIGFGSTGREALRFLYEFSAFPDAEKHKVPVRLIVCDENINRVKSELSNDLPALPDIEAEGEVEFCPYNSGSDGFYRKLHEIIGQLNYVVIATGEDDRNLDIAATLYEFALQHRPDDFRNFKIFVRLYHTTDKFKFDKTINAYAANNTVIEYFGNPDTVYTKNWIIDDEETEAAKQFYKAYCEAVGGSNLGWDGRRNRAKSFLERRELARKESQDKANYKHRYTKEVLLGLRNMEKPFSCPPWPITAGPDDSESLTDWHTRLTNASVCEHLRWNASHFMLGYTRMSEEEKRLYPSGKSEKIRKHHCLTDWDRLDTGTQGYDYAVVQTTVRLYEKQQKQG